MLGLRFTTDAQPRSKKGRPAHSTTGVAQTSWIQFDTDRLTTAVTWVPTTISAIASRNTGNPNPAPIQNRRVMSSSSGLGGSSGETVLGSRAIPHSGQLPGVACTTSGCIGQVYSTVGSVTATSASSAMPQMGQAPGSVSRTSGSIGQVKTDPGGGGAAGAASSGCRYRSGSPWNRVRHPSQQKK